MKTQLVLAPIFGLMLLGSIQPASAQTAAASQPAAAPAASSASGSDLDQGIAAFYLDKDDEAIADFERVLKVDPGNTLAMAYELHAYYRKKDIASVTTRIEQEAASHGNDAFAEAHLGMAYFLRGLIMPNVLEESLNEFKNAIKDDPRCAMAYTGLGMVYFEKRMMPRSKGYFVRALRLNSHDIMALDRLGNILLVDEKKPDEALQLYQRIVEELPSYPDGYYYVGSALYDLGKYEEAIPQLKRCQELDPKGITQGFDAATLVGDTYLKLNRYPDAVAAFEVAQKMQPDSKYVQIKLEKARHPEAAPAPAPLTPKTPKT
jgi:tetratricopeptide (TPR) repeat protein